jgi:hypothetical protein
MPYVSQKIKLQPTQKKSLKLTDEQKEEIRRIYAQGGTSWNNLAKEYGVSKRLIGFILKPETLKENYQRRVDNGGSKRYYDKDKHTVAMRKHRQYKQGLYVNGKLVE